MKKLMMLSLFGLLSISSACSDEDSHSSSDPSCNDATPSACVDDNKGVQECQNGRLVARICPAGCNPSTQACNPVACTPEANPRACNASRAGFTWCENGQLREQSCPTGQICDETTAQCVPPTATCNDTDPATCNNNVLSYCKGGILQSIECNKNVAICDVATKSCLPTAQAACDESFKTKCIDPMTLQSCQDGKIINEPCRAGAVCNPELKEQKCKTPSYGDRCNPETFSEGCTERDTKAITCDEDSKMVIFVDCPKEYGDKYRCDIAEGFYGPGRNAATCTSPAEDCDDPGQERSECAYDANDDVHYTTIEVCAEFNTGNHYYLSEIIDCFPKACNANKTACNE